MKRAWAWYVEGVREAPSFARPSIVCGTIMVIVCPFVIVAAQVWPR